MLLLLFNGRHSVSGRGSLPWLLIRKKSFRRLIQRSEISRSRAALTVSFPLTLDLSSTVSIAGVDVPVILLYGVGAVVAVSLLGGLGGKKRSGSRSAAARRAAKVARLKGELAAAEV